MILVSTALLAQQRTELNAWINEGMEDISVPNHYIHPGWDVSQMQGTIQTHISTLIHIYGQFAVIVW